MKKMLLKLSENRLNKVLSYIALIVIVAAGSHPTLSQTPVQWKEPENLTAVNTKEDEFGPSWNRFENQLYFNSTKTGWSCFYTIDGSFTPPSQLVAGMLNKKNDNRSYICFESDERAYLTMFRQYPDRSWQNIYESGKKGIEWTQPYPVDSLTAESFCAHPTLSPDGSIMVFSSNKNSQKGDADLWIAYRMENGGWGGARPLMGINSSGNDITPFLASNDTLYFASDGLGGPGGFDIFVSVFAMGVWQNAYPLTSINTRHNESDFVVLPDGRAVFASDRPGGTGKLDLYVTKSEEQKNQVVQNEPELELTITTQATTVRTFLGLKFSYYPLCTVVFNVQGVSRPVFPETVPSVEQQIAPVLDSLCYYSLAAIGMRMRQTPDAVLTINRLTSGNDNGSTAEKTLAEEAASFLQAKYSIDADRIRIADMPVFGGIGDVSVYPSLMFTSDTPGLLNPLMLGETEIRLEPPVVQTSVSARPENIFSSYECRLLCNDKVTNYTYSGNSLNEPFYIDLLPLQFDILKADSIVLEVTAKTKDKKKYRESLNINISYSESVTSQVKKTKNGSYEEMYIMMPGITGYMNSSAFDSFLDRVAEVFGRSKSLKIRYFDNSGSVTPAILGQLTRALESKLGTHAGITSEFAEGAQDPFVGESLLKPYVFKLIFEK